MDQMLVASSILLWVVVLLNLFLTLALVRRLNTGSQANKKARETLVVGESAPNFTAETMDGETVTLSTYADRAVAFLFVSADCGPCREEIPGFESLSPKAKLAGVEFILVSGDDVVKTQSFVDDFNINLPIVAAPPKKSSFFKDYKISFTPFYCLVNKQGVVQSVGHPSLEWGEWQTLANTWERHQMDVINSVPSERR